MGRQATQTGMPACARCREAFADGDAVTRLYIAEDPDGELGLSGAFHDHCAAPVWAYATPDLTQPALQ